jgi:hypothetical protein
MDVEWSRHAREKFLMRSMLYGVNYGDVEFEIKRQIVKQKQEGNKIKTIFYLMNRHFTVIKSETKTLIEVITIWESNEKEVELWEKTQ